MPKARIIHLATHGCMDEQKGLENALILAPSNKDDGLLTAGEILDMKLNAELVVLSSNSTALGKITGDGASGLWPSCKSHDHHSGERERDQLSRAPDREQPDPCRNENCIGDNLHTRSPARCAELLG